MFRNELNKIPTHRYQLTLSVAYFFYQGFLSQSQTIHGKAGGGRGPFLFPSSNSTCSRTISHLFTTVHVRWVPHISNSAASNYQNAKRWDFPLWGIIIWFIDENDGMLIVVCLTIQFWICYCILHGKLVGLNSHRLLPWYYKSID